MKNTTTLKVEEKRCLRGGYIAKNQKRGYQGDDLALVISGKISTEMSLRLVSTHKWIIPNIQKKEMMTTNNHVNGLERSHNQRKMSPKVVGLKRIE